MTALISGPCSPLYAFLVLAVVALLAWPLSYLWPFYRRELMVEDRTRLTPLDGLRGLLCFAVMLCHAKITYAFLDSGRWEVPDSRLYALLGQTSVALFFCITAFLFWGRASDRRGEVEPWPFLRARFFRIAPLYVFGCLLALALVGTRVDWFHLTVVNNLLRIGLVGLRPWTPPGPAAVMTANADVTWTLQYEWGFYLFLPALALATRRSAATLIAAAIGTVVFFGFGPPAFFMPGVAAVYAARKPSLALRLRHPLVSVVVLMTIGALPFVLTSGYGVRALLPTTVIFVPIACGNSLFGLLNVRGLRLMGVVSYSVYLLHGLFLYLWRPLLAAAKSGHPAWQYWLDVLVCAGVVLVFSMMTYRWVEWPFIRAEKRMRRSGTDGETGTVAVE